MTETTTELDTAQIRTLLHSGDMQTLAEELRHEHPADIVEMIEDLPPSDMAQVLLCLDRHRQATVFGYFDHDTQVDLAEVLDRKDMARIFGAMAHDERADLFAELTEAQRNALLPGLAQAEREDMRKLAAYPEGTVGSVMTSDYATLSPQMRVPEAIDHLRHVAPDSETIYHSYVVDADRKLIGTVALRDLILARDTATVAEIMRREPPSIRAEEKRAEAVEMIRHYDVLALPVVNGGDRLAGIVTYDDAMDVAEEVETERFTRISAVSGVGTNVLDASLGLLYRKRIPWLLILVFGNVFSGIGIAIYEDTIAAHVALVFFLPLLIASGGNAGSQSSTLMVRALATGDVELSDWARMLGRELAVAAALAATMAVAVSSIGFVRGGPSIALVVSLTMVLIVIVGSLIGMMLPLLLSKFNVDPATASAPLVTSIADATGVLIYFAIATWVLGLGTI